MKTLFFFSIIIVLLCGCMKNPEPQYRKLEPEMRSAATLKEGSYFIYKDSASASLDSFWVYFFQGGFATAGEYANAYLKDKQGNEFLVMADFTLSSKPILYGQFHDCFTDLISLPFKENTKQEWAYNLKHYPGLLVNGKTYADVYETFTFRKHAEWPYDTLYTFHAFYSTESGLVKFSYHHQNDTLLTTHGTWELERSKIIR